MGLPDTFRIILYVPVLATGVKQEKLQAQIDRLELELLAAQEKKERALSMAQQTKRGHVYVISNIGSFGENVYKIGMTRRLEPLDRVRELGDASVPFQFDVHAMIYSDEARTLENELHKAFTNKKVNMLKWLP
ncbi:GIY-YIG nuclease family protein [archaeon]|nr:MAG: GIY-YIG nuclease family protein [archaeon]